MPGDNGNGKVDSLGEGLKIFGSGYLQGLKAPFEFLGDARDAVTGRNGGAGDRWTQRMATCRGQSQRCCRRGQRRRRDTTSLWRA